MNILSVPYYAGGLSHLIPLYVLHHKHLGKNIKFKNHFLVTNNIKRSLEIHSINCVNIDFFRDSNECPSISEEDSKVIEYVIKKEKEAYEKIKPVLIIEDNSFVTPLIAEKNGIPRISIQRTGDFRAIDNCFRNSNHVHSSQKGITTERGSFRSSTINLQIPTLNHSDTFFLHQYREPKVKIIPGIPTIERLPKSIEDRSSYFYSGPLLVMDKPSKDISDRLNLFLNYNKQKPVVFITTGTIDRTPIENFIEFFIKRNYAVITTSECKINEEYKQEVFYNKLLPLNYICGISDLVIHQCGSGMYHYPIMNRVPALTIGTLCYDREDIAQRLQEIGVSGHIPHPDDDPNYWYIFLELVSQFERNTLIDFDMMDKLRIEINETGANFQMDKIIEFALS
jgi:hypothetical protein